MSFLKNSFLIDFPELNRNAINSMKASMAFWLGFKRRVFNKKRKKNKVFVIGFHKTGTSSLGKALQILGYRVCGSLKQAQGFQYPKNYDDFLDFIIDNARHEIIKYDAFQDTPWFLIYKQLYNLYPNSYFILTRRESSKWISSVQKHFGKNEYPFHKQIYNSYDSFNNKDTYLNIYNTHNQNVKEFFLEKNNLLILDTDNFNWDDLCHFLNESIPKCNFPYANAAQNKGSIENRLKKIIKSYLYNKESF